ncbi:MAG: TrbI/VirB10 family protein [Sphingorhabdus sp.]
MTDTGPEVPSAALPKADPETLVLRGRPRRPVRVRRNVIIAGSVTISLFLVCATWLALSPDAFVPARERDDSAEFVAGGSPDALAGVPGSYGDIPKLGPPLPGDLGRPILAHQRNVERSMASGNADDADMVLAPRRRRSRVRADFEDGQASRSAPVMFALQARATAPDTTASAASMPDDEAATQMLPGSDPQRAAARSSFLAGNAGPATNAHTLVPALSPFMLHTGTTISASLITGVNSDLPGTVIAQVTENVRDSVTGRHVLVPQGARLVGRYDNAIAFGQKRVLLVWQRLVLPDGASIMLDNAPATDASGYSGLADQVDFHDLQMLKGVAVATLLGIGTELSAGHERGLIGALREAAQTSTSTAGEQFAARNLDIAPTINIRPGFPLRVMVHRDIVLKPWRHVR